MYEERENNQEANKCKLQYSALNRMDLLQAAGKYPVPNGASPILGVEVSGFVKSKSGSCLRNDIVVGDPVAALLQGGGYAEYAVVDERVVIKLSSSNKEDLIKFAAVPEVGDLYVYKSIHIYMYIYVYIYFSLYIYTLKRIIHIFTHP